ncbi:MAG: hypothetical protein HYW48_00175 [Deltaproteobacteria bacterium]|nr:hypothetical protein [Deltaproteobacteria bacterium]
MRRKFVFVAFGLSLMATGASAETKAKTAKPAPAVVQPSEASTKTAKVQPTEEAVPLPQGQQVPAAQQPIEDEEMDSDATQHYDEDDASYQWDEQD